MSTSSTNLQTQIQVNKVLRHELETMKPGRKVFVQQPGSLIFFKDNRDEVLRTCQNTIKSLQREYEQLQNRMEIDK